MSLGVKIRTFRRERRMTLAQVSAKLNVSPSFLSLVERDIKKPSLIMLRKISQILNISLSYLVTDPSEGSLASEKLRSLRQSRGLTVEDLAELSELPMKDITGIEKNEIHPTLDHLEKLSTALNIPNQYLSGRNFTTEQLGDKVKTCREQKQLTQSDLANAIGVSPSLISQIESNVTFPSLETLGLIATCLNVEISYFLIDSINANNYLASLSPDLLSLLGDLKVQAVLTSIRDLQPGELNFLLNFIEFFKLNRSNLT